MKIHLKQRLFKHLFLLSFILVNQSTQAENCHDQYGIVYDADNQELHLSSVEINQKFSLGGSMQQLDSRLPFHFELSQVNQPGARQDNARFSGQSLTLSLPSVCIQEGDQIHSGYQVEMRQIPHSDPIQFIVSQVSQADDQSLYQWPLKNKHGELFIPHRSHFDRYANLTQISGINTLRELKFIMVDLDSDHPALFFIDSVNIPLHYDFLRNILNRYPDIEYWQGNTQFTAETYFSENRRYLAGSIVAYDQYEDDTGQKGLYSLEFWPTDPVPEHLIEKAYETIQAAMPFLADSLYYHPVGLTHERVLSGFADDFADNNIRTIRTEDLFSQLNRYGLNNGESYGRLQLINPGDPEPGEDVIAIYSFIPNTLGHIGGIITEQPQTSLSHINLKARQNNTPNAYIANASNLEEIEPLLNGWVHYQVTEEGVSLEAATETQATAWLADLIPKETTIPNAELTLEHPQPLSELGYHDWIHVGVKAANVAELGKILNPDIAPVGYALPFTLYDQFMNTHRCIADMTELCQGSTGQSFYAYIAELLEDSAFQQDREVRKQHLAQLRELIEKTDTRTALKETIESIRAFWEPLGEPYRQSLRVRSSTNNEDLEGFNGAGLYESYTHKPSEGKLINTVKQVWAGLWTDRAFEERRLHNIDHLKTYMGVLIHTNYGDEQANGVAISKNIYNPGFEGVYINAQHGELSVTNPEPIATETGLINAIPDEIIMTFLPASISGSAWETQFIRHSNVSHVYDKPVSSEKVLSDAEIELLRDNIQLIHNHFRELYQGDDAFAMDIEFKITETADGSRGNLAIKQARPWVD